MVCLYTNKKPYRQQEETPPHISRKKKGKQNKKTTDDEKWKHPGIITNLVTHARMHQESKKKTKTNR